MKKSEKVIYSIIPFISHSGKRGTIGMISRTMVARHLRWEKRIENVKLVGHFRVVKQFWTVKNSFMMTNHFELYVFSNFRFCCIGFSKRKEHTLYLLCMYYRIYRES